MGSTRESGKNPGKGNGNPLLGFLAWRILWTEEPGGLQSTGFDDQGVCHQVSWSTRQMEEETASPETKEGGGSGGINFKNLSHSA